MPSRPSASNFERKRTMMRSRSGCTEVSTSTGVPSNTKLLASRPVHMSSVWRVADRSLNATVLPSAFTRYRPRRPSEKRCGFSRSHWISGFFACSQSLKYGYHCVLPRTLMGTSACSSVKPLRIRKAVPGPLRLGHQRHERRILVLEGLQAGDVGREGQIAVAHHEGRRLVDDRDGGVMAGHQRVTVDGRTHRHPRCYQSRNQANES